MKNRGRVVLGLVVGLALLAAFTLSYAANKVPDKDLVIHTTDVFKTTKQSPVTFSHAKHKDAKCISCHHEYKDGKNVWQEGQEVKKCGVCHKLEAQDKVVKLEKAYHDNCVGCHKKLKAEKKKGGPTACTKCHPKKEGAKEGGEEKK